MGILKIFQIILYDSFIKIYLLGYMKMYYIKFPTVNKLLTNARVEFIDSSNKIFCYLLYHKMQIN